MTDGVERCGESRPNFGAMHVHTTFSDGGIHIEDAIDAAQKAELDFLFITDHNTIEARHYQGYHGNLLLAVDVEVSPTPFWNHVIALGLEDYEELHRLKDPHRILDAIIEGGGVPWVPHPRGFFNPYCGVFNLPWRVWDSRVRALELATFCVEWVESLRPWNFLSVFRNPARYVRGPHPKLLRRWDELNAQSSRPVNAYVGLDAHFRSALGGKLQTPAYEFLFRTNNLLAWTPPRTGDAETDLRVLRETLDAGRFLSVMSHVGGRRPLDISASGESVMVHGLETATAAPISTRLIRDGRVVCKRDGGGGSVAAGEDFTRLSPGRYRVEIDFQGRLWALSNPVEVKSRVESPQTATAATL